MHGRNRELNWAVSCIPCSPSLAAMIAHKKGYNPLLGEPSPPSHIKAVFGTTEDREFYGPMAGEYLQSCCLRTLVLQGLLAKLELGG